MKRKSTCSLASGSRAFDGLLDSFFEARLKDNPIAAAYAGLRTGEGRLGDTGREFVRAQARQRTRALAALENISPRELSVEQHLDRLAWRSLLLREAEDYERGRETLEPIAIHVVLGICLHELMRGEFEPRRAAANLRGLLREMPDYLAQAVTLVTRPEPLWRSQMEHTVAGAGALFDAAQRFLAAHGARDDDAAILAAARRGVSAYRDAVMELPLAAEGSFALGATAMQRRVRDELGLDYTLGQVESLALSEVERIGGLLAAACSRFGKRAKPEDVLAEARAAWNPEGPLTTIYQRETARVAEAFRAARAVTFPPGESLVVRPVPEFMRHLLPTAAYDAPGPFAAKQRGVFWVNDLSVGKKTAAEKRAERQQHFGLSLTCAHEAYPGHHLQFATQNRHARRWRRLFAHAVFYEGWTLWCEQMMVDLRVDRSPWLRVQQLHDALWRCHRILVDLRLQTGRYGFSDAVRHLQRAVGFTRARAEADVNWYTSSPAVPMSYWLGRLENERMRQRLMVRRGWSLCRFNDWLLSFGTLPQAWIEKYGLD